MLRRRKRPKVVWLPFDLFHRLGEDPQSPATSDSASGVLQIDRDLNVQAGYGFQYTEVYPLVKDFADQVSPNTTLADLEQTGYRLRRVVGRLFVAVAQTTADPDANNFETDTWLVNCGIAVLRTNSAGTPVAPAADEYAVQTYANHDFPWIWQRSWILQDQTKALKSGIIFGDFITWPYNNTLYNSKFDDHNVDQKTARIIGPDERLCLVVTTTNWNGENNNSPANQLTITFDYRILASMRTNSGNRRNANR